MIQNIKELVIQKLNSKEKLIILKKEESAKIIEWVRISNYEPESMIILGVISLTREKGGNKLVSFKASKSKLQDGKLEPEEVFEFIEIVSLNDSYNED